MTTSTGIDQDERFLARIAWACEVEGITQAQAAKRFGVTRLRVNKALGEARRKGIVRVSVHSRYSVCAEVEQQLRSAFDLTDAHVAPTLAASEAVQNLVGSALGHTLSTLLADAAIKRFGIAWGATLDLAMPFIRPLNRPDLDIVSAMGSLTQGSDLNIIEITRRLANRCNAQTRYFTAPLYAGSSASRDIVLGQPVFSEMIERIRNADAMAMALGDMSARSLLIRSGLPGAATVEELTQLGAVGDALGHFLNADGQLVEHDINRSVVGLSLDELREIPNVIVAAGGLHKVPILRAVLQRQLVDTLITDQATASALLRQSTVHQGSAGHGSVLR